MQKIHNLEESLKEQGVSDEKTLHRVARLKGVITWNIKTEYHDRFTEAVEHLAELDDHVARLQEIYESFVRTRQAATQSYKGYEKPLQRLRIKIRDALGKVKVLMARQGHMIEVMAINELEQRRQSLEEYQVKARFAMAESYDRATKAKQEQIEKDALRKNSENPQSEQKEQPDKEISNQSAVDKSAVDSEAVESIESASQ